MSPKISVIIPAYNEEESLPHVLNDLPQDRLHQVIVVDNSSTDRTAEVARANGATVVYEKRRGYGQACLSGMDALDNPDAVVFLDGDYSDFPEEIDLLLEPILADEADLLPQARYGNQLAVFLIRLFFGHRFTDLGPFRAIRYESLQAIGMQDKNFGWTVEMQIKAVQKGLSIREVPVRYRMRIGVSKITGTVSGTLKAGTKIIYTIFKYLIT